MMDLIYAGEQEQQARRDIKRLWPEAIITDASDYIHRGRLEVALDIEPDDYYIGLCRMGLHVCSFNFSSRQRGNPEKANWWMQRANELGPLAVLESQP